MRPGAWELMLLAATTRVPRKLLGLSADRVEKATGRDLRAITRPEVRRRVPSRVATESLHRPIDTSLSNEFGCGRVIGPVASSRIRWEETAEEHKLRGLRSGYGSSHCRAARKYEQYVVEEYLLYRVLNLPTLLSYRPRLAQVTYHDEDAGSELTRYAFFTEREEHMAARNGWKTLNVEAVPLARIEPNQTALLSVFQYMIGNVDWSVLDGPAGKPCCHNIQLVGDDEGVFIPVPYDFDSAGVIDVGYAVPHVSLPIYSVRERLFRGYCIHNNYLPEILARFRDKRSEIYELYRGERALDPGRVSHALEYYDRFFELIANPEEIQSELVRTCR